jgi:hypothetical protein
MENSREQILNLSLFVQTFIIVRAPPEVAWRRLSVKRRMPGIKA